jgi:hypothetical protein
LRPHLTQTLRRDLVAGPEGSSMAELIADMFASLDGYAGGENVGPFIG